MIRHTFTPSRPLCFSTAKSGGTVDALLAMYLMVWQDYRGRLGTDETAADSLLDLLESLICTARAGTTRDLLAKARMAAMLNYRDHGDESGRFDRDGREINPEEDASSLPLATMLEDLEAASAASPAPAENGVNATIATALPISSSFFDDPALVIDRMRHLVDGRLYGTFDGLSFEEENEVEGDLQITMELSCLLERLLAACPAPTAEGQAVKARLLLRGIEGPPGSDDTMDTTLAKSLAADLEAAGRKEG